MKVSTQEIEQRQVVLEVEVEDERVERALDQAYKRIAQRVKVPGFRPGRAPRPLVERMVGREAILEDAVEHLVPEVYRTVLEEQQIKPAGQPSLEVTSTEPLHFKATVPLEPSVQLGDYRSIEVALEPIIADDASVDEVIERLRENHATWAPVERAAQIGDRVGIDVSATRGERSVMDTHDAEFVLDPNGPEPAPGFSEQIVGLEGGQQRTFTMGGPKEGKSEEAESAEGDESAASEPTVFEVTVHWVKEKQLPELDDEFARTVGEQETMEALREEIRDRIRSGKEQQAREKQREEIVKLAVDGARVEIPPQLVERQARQSLDTMASMLDRQGISVEQYLQFTGKDPDEFRSELMSDAESSLKRSLVLEAIAREEGLAASDDEVREEIQLASQSAKDPARTARQAFARPETRSRIETILLTRKGLQRLLELTGAAPADTPAETVEASEPSVAEEPVAVEATGESHV